MRSRRLLHTGISASRFFPGPPTGNCFGLRLVMGPDLFFDRSDSQTLGHDPFGKILLKSPIGSSEQRSCVSGRSINQAAIEAYQLLRAQNPTSPICVLGESIGSGPASALAREKIAPDKIVLVVPFDALANVASRHFPFLPVRLMLRDAWDNVESLKDYNGPVEIFGARADAIIPLEHARALAKQIPAARFVEIAGGHNDWPQSDQVRIQL